MQVVFHAVGHREDEEHLHDDYYQVFNGQQVRPLYLTAVLMLKLITNPPFPAPIIVLLSSAKNNSEQILYGLHKVRIKHPNKLHAHNPINQRHIIKRWYCYWACYVIYD